MKAKTNLRASVGKGLARAAAGAVLATVGALLVWGSALAVRGGWSRVVPQVQAPRRTEQAYVVREAGTGRYLLYTEIELHEGDLIIAPDNTLYRIERVGFDTAWARRMGRRGRP